MSKVFALSPQDFLNGFTKNQVELIDQFYDDEAVLEDPFVHLKGKEAIKKYNLELYQDILSISFKFTSDLRQGNEQSLTWDIQLSHRKLNGGQPLTSKGATYVRYSPKSKKVIFHRDYYDTGPTIYENIPLIGWFIRKLRGELRNESPPILLK